MSACISRCGRRIAFFAWLVVPVRAWFSWGGGSPAGSPPGLGPGDVETRGLTNVATSALATLSRDEDVHLQELALEYVQRFARVSVSSSEIASTSARDGVTVVSPQAVYASGDLARLHQVLQASSHGAGVAPLRVGAETNNAPGVGRPSFPGAYAEPQQSEADSLAGASSNSSRRSGDANVQWGAVRIREVQALHSQGEDPVDFVRVLPLRRVTSGPLGRGAKKAKSRAAREAAFGGSPGNHASGAAKKPPVFVLLAVRSRSRRAEVLHPETGDVLAEFGGEVVCRQVSATPIAIDVAPKSEAERAEVVSDPRDERQRENRTLDAAEHHHASGVEALDEGDRFRRVFTQLPAASRGAIAVRAPSALDQSADRYLIYRDECTGVLVEVGIHTDEIILHMSIAASGDAIVRFEFI